MSKKKKNSPNKVIEQTVYKFQNVQCIKLLDRMSIVRGIVNIKHGFNGLGKSSIGKALDAKINGKSMDSLIPYETSLTPTVTIVDGKPFDKAHVFNQEYIENSLFQKDFVSPDTPQTFVFNDQVNAQIDLIKDKACDISKYLEADEILKLYSDIPDYKGQFSNKEEDYNAFNPKNTLGQGFKAGASIKDITSELIFNTFQDFIKRDDHANWYKWRLQANPEWIETNKCPYCGQEINKDEVKLFNEDFTKTDINKPDPQKYVDAVEIINKLKLYAKDDHDRNLLDKFLIDGSLTSSNEIKEIYRINDYIQGEISKLESLSTLAETFLYEKEKFKVINLDDYIRNLKLDISCYQNFTVPGVESKQFIDKVNILNNLIDNLLTQCINLKSAVQKISDEIDSTISENEKKINKFLSLAGIPYYFGIEKAKKDYKTVIKARAFEDSTRLSKRKDVINNLSFGEKNSLSMALFAAIVKNTPENDLIILDDPISSFDDNKKYAVLHYLFNEEDGMLKGKTVLMLTHDQEPIIDLYYKKIINNDLSIANAYVLKKGIDYTITEQIIKKEDFISTYDYENACVKNENKDLFLRLFHLRKLFEISKIASTDAYNIVTGAVKMYEKPSKSPNPKDSMKDEDIENCEKNELCKYIPGFKYTDFYEKYHYFDVLADLYNYTEDKIEKISILRTMINYCNFLRNDDNLPPMVANDVLMYFFNDTYHPENDALYTLKNYENIPPYIIDECNKVYKEIIKQFKEISNFKDYIKNTLE